MLKKTITFQDLDGNPVTEDFYFNLSKMELAELELSYKGGISNHLSNVIKTQDPALVMSTFKNIISQSVGRRSEDGRRFEKSEKIRDEFFQSDAYSELFLVLVTSAEQASEFVKGIMPADLAEEAAKLTLASATKPEDAANVDAAVQEIAARQEPQEPAWIRENREPNQQELTTMSQAELVEAYRRKAAAQTPSGPIL